MDLVRRFRYFAIHVLARRKKTTLSAQFGQVPQKYYLIDTVDKKLDYELVIGPLISILVLGEVLADVEPQGLYGSGLTDIVAPLRRDGCIEPTGAFSDTPCASMGTVDGKPAYQLVPDSDLWLTQKDVRELQLAKGAMAAGVQLLLQEADVGDEQVEKVCLAGGFGQYLDAGNAAGIGLILNAWVDRVIKVGNGSGLGAQIYMLNRHCHEYTASLPKTMQYVEPSACTRQNRAAASITAGLFFLCGNKDRIRHIQNLAKTRKTPSSQQCYACYWASRGSAKLARTQEDANLGFAQLTAWILLKAGFIMQRHAAAEPSIKTIYSKKRAIFYKKYRSLSATLDKTASASCSL